MFFNFRRERDDNKDSGHEIKYVMPECLIEIMNITSSYIPAFHASAAPSHAAMRPDTMAAEENDGNKDTDRASRKDAALQTGETNGADRDSRNRGNGDSSAANTQKAPDGHELTPEEMRQLDELQARDREVHAHEQAHIAAGGRYVRSGASYHYQTGPDGKKYAIGGEVSIDTSEEKDPRATIRKMETVRKAALAPARPSAKDRAIASQAGRKMAEAAAELAKMQAEEKPEQAEQAQNGQVGETPSPEMFRDTGSVAGESAVPMAQVTGSMIDAYV